jgi:zinc protease
MTGSGLGVGVGLVLCFGALSGSPAASAQVIPPDRSAPPPVLDPSPPPFPPVQVLALSDGTPVWLIERHELPLIRVEVSLRRGSLDLDDPLPALMAEALLGEGTTHREATELDDALSDLGAELDLGLGALRAWADLSLIRGTEAEALALQREALLEPRLPRDELRRTRRAWIRERREAWRSGDAVLSAALTEAVYPAEHPLGIVYGARDYRGLRLRAVRAAWATELESAQPMFLVVGDTTAAAILPELERAWAGRLPGEAVAPPLAPPPKHGRRLILVDQPGTSQTLITLSLPAPVPGSADEVAFTLANTVLGGTFTSRLNRNLREEKGYTYGVYSEINGWPGHARCQISTSVEAKFAALAVAELLSELARMGSHPPDAVELRAARNALLLSGNDALTTLAGLGYPFGRAQTWGDAPEAVGARYAALAATTDAEVVAAARRLSAEGAEPIVVIVGDAEVVEPLLEAAGLAPDARWDRRRLVAGRRAAR